MRRILLSCAASLLVYTVAFGCLLDRPLTLGALRVRLDANLAAGATIDEPKLVILAGSNGPYSHRCTIIGPLIHRPCVNAGVAVGVGLDYLFLRWEALLYPGDVVYLPLEEAQYVRERAAVALGPDAAIMLRHDRTSLLQMPLDRQVAALFSSDVRAAIMSLLETALVHTGFRDPRAEATGSTNVWGDHIGHTLALAAGNASALKVETPFHPTAAQIEHGYGSVEVGAFLRWAETHQVQVIGGLPTGFADSPISDASLAAIRAVYRDGGAEFLVLANHSRYPRADFFDSPDHLNEPAQIRHSWAVALALRPMVARSMASSLAPLAPPAPPGPKVRLVTSDADPSPPAPR
jgi:hypothetical protein